MIIQNISEINLLIFLEKKELMFLRIGTFKDLYKYEEGIIEEYCQKISEYIGSELNDILTPNFSTSTKDTIIAGKVSIMSIFKKYFHYSGGFCTCGINSIYFIRRNFRRLGKNT